MPLIYKPKQQNINSQRRILLKDLSEQVTIAKKKKKQNKPLFLFCFPLLQHRVWKVCWEIKHLSDVIF